MNEMIICVTRAAALVAEAAGQLDAAQAALGQHHHAQALDLQAAREHLRHAIAALGHALARVKQD